MQRFPLLIIEGGPGSGHHGHKGLKGVWGGSSSGTGKVGSEMVPVPKFDAALGKYLVSRFAHHDTEIRKVGDHFSVGRFSSNKDGSFLRTWQGKEAGSPNIGDERLELSYWPKSGGRRGKWAVHAAQWIERVGADGKKVRYWSEVVSKPYGYISPSVAINVGISALNKWRRRVKE